MKTSLCLCLFQLCLFQFMSISHTQTHTCACLHTHTCACIHTRTHTHIYIGLARTLYIYTLHDRISISDFPAKNNVYLLVIPLPKIPCIHRIYTIIANPTYTRSQTRHTHTYARTKSRTQTHSRCELRCRVWGWPCPLSTPFSAGTQWALLQRQKQTGLP